MKPVKPKNQQASPPPQETMLDEAMATQMVKSAYTRERAVFLMRLCISSMVTNMLFAVIIGFLALRPLQYLYFWTNGDGSIHQMIPLKEPVLSDSERVLWVTQAVTQALNIDFTNYKVQMQENRKNFTPEGYVAFSKAMQNSGIIGSVISYKYVLSAVPTATPIEAGRGNLPPDGRYGWQYEVPLLLTYQATDRNNTQPITVQLVVVRVPETENPRGMAIARFEAK